MEKQMQQNHALSYDLIILGGGSGGLTAARLARSLGARTLLIEKERLGGECLHSGCVPSKSLIHVARLLHQARQVQRFSRKVDTFAVDLVPLAAYLQEVIEQVRETERPFLDGVSVQFGHATFLSSTMVRLNGTVFTGRAMVIATGSRPDVPAIPGLTEIDFLTNETIFDLTTLPASLAIIGGGPIGVELGQAFARLGSRVTLLQRATRLLPREDPDVSAAIAGALQTDGVSIFLQTRVLRVSKQGKDCVLTIQQDQQEREITVSAVLLATGRQPNVESLRLEAAGVIANTRGIVVDRFLRTSAPTIYAIGDVIGGYHFSHLAAAQAATAVRNALVPFAARPRDERVLPWCTFTDPEAGRVGCLPGEASHRYRQVRVVTLPFTEIDRAQTDEATAGFLKLVLAGKREEIVGAHLVGSHAGELLGELALAMRHRLPLSALLSTIHPYPTFSTGLQQLAFQAYLEGDRARHDRTVVQTWLALRRWFARLLSRSPERKERV